MTIFQMSIFLRKTLLTKVISNIQLEYVRHHRVIPLPDPMPYTTAVWRKRFPFRHKTQFEVTHDEVYTKDMQLKTLDERRQGKKRAFLFRRTSSFESNCILEFDPQPLRVDKVNIGILKPLNPVSKAESQARVEHCSVQRNRADLKKLHYDTARMYL